MTNFARLIAKQLNSKVILYRATTKDGQDFYAYIRCNEKQARKMKQDFLEKTPCRDVADYGEVIYKTFGKNPDEKAKNFLSEYLKNM